VRLAFHHPFFSHVRPAFQHLKKRSGAVLTSLGAVATTGIIEGTIMELLRIMVTQCDADPLLRDSSKVGVELGKGVTHSRQTHLPPPSPRRSKGG
jgi:hypothetical protein